MFPCALFAVSISILCDMLRAFACRQVKDAAVPPNQRARVHLPPAEGPAEGLRHAPPEVEVSPAIYCVWWRDQEHGAIHP